LPQTLRGESLRFDLHDRIGIAIGTHTAAAAPNGPTF
jgi:hypothetical protein